MNFKCVKCDDLWFCETEIKGVIVRQWGTSRMQAFENLLGTLDAIPSVTWECPDEAPGPVCVQSIKAGTVPVLPSAQNVNIHSYNP